ncbi:MAG: hypothetical protein JWN72_228 [Thermoleophilia bacterium]|nr:hypothetical protein [Thermoleophilia bacterium]
MTRLLRHDLYTIGHSNRDVATLVDLLDENAIQLVVDVRAFPGSRRQPHFARPALARELSVAGIAYQHMSALGGRRRGGDVPPEVGAGWRSDSFAAYARYAQTAPFVFALRDLLTLATGRRVAIMCSEAVPWRCHRWLISDAVVAQGWRVLHVMGEHALREHVLSPFSVVDAGQVTWPGPPSAEALRLGRNVHVG